MDTLWRTRTRRVQRPLRAICFAAAIFFVGATVHSQTPAVSSLISWARIPAGTFQMGCVPGDPRCSVDEHPRRTVTFSRPFDMMTTEVTVGMYRSASRHVGEQPAWSTRPDHPVVIVTWDEAQAFCQAVGARLPTEAEWEYAARGGRDGVLYPWGDQPPLDTEGAANGAAFEGDAARTVGSFAPNGYGLYDVAGNVWEWTADAGGLYVSDEFGDPTGPVSGRNRLVRGGSYGDGPSNLRVSNRTPNQPTSVNVNVGLRCARDAPL